MINSRESATARLTLLADLLDEAGIVAQVDATGLSDLLDGGRRQLNEIQQAINLSHDDGAHAGLVAAAERARQSHARLVTVVQGEMDRLSGELARLNAGSTATQRYAVGEQAGRPATAIDKVG